MVNITLLHALLKPFILLLNQTATQPDNLIWLAIALVGLGFAWFENMLLLKIAELLNNLATTDEERRPLLGDVGPVGERSIEAENQEEELRNTPLETINHDPIQTIQGPHTPTGYDANDSYVIQDTVNKEEEEDLGSSTVFVLPDLLTPNLPPPNSSDPPTLSPSSTSIPPLSAPTTLHHSQLKHNQSLLKLLASPSPAPYQPDSIPQTPLDAFLQLETEIIRYLLTSLETSKTRLDSKAKQTESLLNSFIEDLDKTTSAVFQTPISSSGFKNLKEEMKVEVQVLQAEVYFLRGLGQLVSGREIKGAMNLRKTLGILQTLQKPNVVPPFLVEAYEILELLGVFLGSLTRLGERGWRKVLGPLGIPVVSEKDFLEFVLRDVDGEVKQGRGEVLRVGVGVWSLLSSSSGFIHFSPLGEMYALYLLKGLESWGEKSGLGRLWRCLILKRVGRFAEAQVGWEGLWKEGNLRAGLEAGIWKALNRDWEGSRKVLSVVWGLSSADYFDYGPLVGLHLLGALLLSDPSAKSGIQTLKTELKSQLLQSIHSPTLSTRTRKSSFTKLQIALLPLLEPPYELHAEVWVLAILYLRRDLKDLVVGKDEEDAEIILEEWMTKLKQFIPSTAASTNSSSSSSTNTMTTAMDVAQPLVYLLLGTVEKYLGFLKKTKNKKNYSRSRDYLLHSLSLARAMYQSRKPEEKEGPLDWVIPHVGFELAELEVLRGQGGRGAVYLRLMLGLEVSTSAKGRAVEGGTSFQEVVGGLKDWVGQNGGGVDSMILEEQEEAEDVTGVRVGVRLRRERSLTSETLEAVGRALSPKRKGTRSASIGGGSLSPKNKSHTIDGDGEGGGDKVEGFVVSSRFVMHESWRKRCWAALKQVDEGKAGNGVPI
ncbi:hypothetical protein HDV05_001601 [Chytridiales sp. JEL 0842]|nr:hypothetical protein HDV05_001601 [Chytridiales sp. JEL 0842]